MAANTDTPALPVPTTDRRAFFSAAALLGAASVLPTTIPAAGATVLASVVAPTADDDDGEAYTEAEMIAFCAEWRGRIEEYMSLTLRLGDLLEEDQPAADRARHDALGANIHELEEIIFDTPARTFAGLQAKAEILAFMGTEMGIPVDSSHGWSLVEDILALASAA